MMQSRNAGKVTVSIVSYFTDEAEMRHAVSCLKCGSVGKVYIVDNAKEKRMERLAGELGAAYIPNENRGYGAGHNLAIRRTLESGEPYHLVMNSDLSFSPCDLDKMVEYMDAHSDVGALHPRVVGVDGADQFTVRMLPTPFDLILRRFIPKCLFKEARDRYLLKHLDHGKEHDVHYMQGSFMLMRTDVLRRAGCFDERFFMYPEDIDLTRRIARISRAVYWPEAVVCHKHAAASYKSLRMLRVHIVNMARYFNKWGWWTDRERAAANKSML